jgi:hypothetical protein
MGIEWFRDLFICILGAINIVVMVFISILAYSIYRQSQYLIGIVESLCQKADIVLNDLETTSETVRGIASNIKQAITDPVAQIISIIQGIRQGFNLVNKLFKKEEEKENE